MNLKINDSFYISDITPSDKPAYIEHFKEKEIYNNVSAIPYPYKEEDADWWIDHIQSVTKENGRSINWAIRRSEDNYLVGGIGFLGLKIGTSHTAELGYWLAKPYWGKNIMTVAVKVATEYGFKEFGLIRVTANVFDFNKRSARVLEKAGYQCEGHLRKHFKKDGKIFDGQLFAKLADTTEINVPSQTNTL